MGTPVAAYTTQAALQPRDATLHGTISLPALCAYLQDAAGGHAAELGVAQTDLLDRHQSWVLVQFQVEATRLPRWTDTLGIETWPSGLQGPFAQREFLLHVDDALIGRATSTWVVFDQKRRRPARPPRILQDLTLPDRPVALAPREEEITVPDRADHRRRFRVRFHDLDLNAHVNNARYVAWALETLPLDWLQAYRAEGLTLDFKSETTANMQVAATATCCAVPDTDRVRVVHHLADADADTTLARAETHWTPIAGR